MPPTRGGSGGGGAADDAPQQQPQQPQQQQPDPLVLYRSERARQKRAQEERAPRLVAEAARQLDAWWVGERSRELVARRVARVPEGAAPAPPKSHGTAEAAARAKGDVRAWRDGRRQKQQQQQEGQPAAAKGAAADPTAADAATAKDATTTAAPATPAPAPLPRELHRLLQPLLPLPPTTEPGPPHPAPLPLAAKGPGPAHAAAGALGPNARYTLNATRQPDGSGGGGAAVGGWDLSRRATVAVTCRVLPRVPALPPFVTWDYLTRSELAVDAGRRMFYTDETGETVPASDDGDDSSGSGSGSGSEEEEEDGSGGSSSGDDEEEDGGLVVKPENDGAEEEQEEVDADGDARMKGDGGGGGGGAKKLPKQQQLQQKKKPASKPAPAATAAAAVPYAMAPWNEPDGALADRTLLAVMAVLGVGGAGGGGAGAAAAAPAAAADDRAPPANQPPAADARADARAVAALARALAPAIGRGGGGVRETQLRSRLEALRKRQRAAAPPTSEEERRAGVGGVGVGVGGGSAGSGTTDPFGTALLEMSAQLCRRCRVYGCRTHARAALGRPGGPRPHRTPAPPPPTPADAPLCGAQCWRRPTQQPERGGGEDAMDVDGTAAAGGAASRPSSAAVRPPPSPLDAYDTSLIDGLGVRMLGRDPCRLARLLGGGSKEGGNGAPPCASVAAHLGMFPPPPPTDGSDAAATTAAAAAAAAAAASAQQQRARTAAASAARWAPGRRKGGGGAGGADNPAGLGAGLSATPHLDTPTVASSTSNAVRAAIVRRRMALAAAGDSMPDYEPCACPGPCRPAAAGAPPGSGCPCVMSGNFCEKFCGCVAPACVGGVRGANQLFASWGGGLGTGDPAGPGAYLHASSAAAAAAAALASAGGVIGPSGNVLYGAAAAKHLRVLAGSGGGRGAGGGGRGGAAAGEQQAQKQRRAPSSSSLLLPKTPLPPPAPPVPALGDCRFEGCRCRGSCSSRTCPCLAAGRECDPDLCRGCAPAADEAAARLRRAAGFLAPGGNSAAAGPADAPAAAAAPPTTAQRACQNMNMRTRRHARVGMGLSTVAGWGAFALAPLRRGGYVGEYCGDLLTQREADRRGRVYDKIDSSYLFNADRRWVIDARQRGSKLRLANHSSAPNCAARVLLVDGDHRVAIFAAAEVKPGDELFYNYRYALDNAPEWAQEK